MNDCFSTYCFESHTEAKTKFDAFVKEKKKNIFYILRLLFYVSKLRLFLDK